MPSGQLTSGAAGKKGGIISRCVTVVLYFAIFKSDGSKPNF